MYKYNYLSQANFPKDIKKLDIKELEILCQEIRDFIIEHVVVTGGHLGSSLGAVELVVALLKVFNIPQDKIVWDIGHQAYAYKILTGRRDKFHTIRQNQGLSGFSNPVESEYDNFIGGHSSTSISSAIGLKVALDKKGDEAEVISVIGDAAIGAGMAFEAINHAGVLNKKIIVILNDNTMSISKTEGALGEYFAKIRSSKSYNKIKDIGDMVKDKMPSPIGKIIEKVDEQVDSLTRTGSSANIFEEMGFNYIGVIDGHNLTNLVDVLSNIKNNYDNKPVLLHLITKKGNGHKDAEIASDCLHGVNPQTVEKSAEEKENTLVSSEATVSNTNLFVEELSNIASKDDKVVAITAAMLHGTGLLSFQKRFPDRLYDVGIAEQHAVTFGAGLAKGGLKPFVCIYSTFMQRAYDQVVHDVCLSSLPVRIIMDRGGFVGADGCTHHGLLDYSMFLPLPNIVFMAPAFREDLQNMVKLMVNINDKPSFLRFSKNNLNPISFYQNLGYNFSDSDNINTDSLLVQGRIIQTGEDIAVISLGEILHEIILASEKLKNNSNKKITIADMRFAKPIDEKLVISLANKHKTIIVVEEGFSSIFASYITKILIDNNLLDQVNLKYITIEDKYVEHASLYDQRKKAKVNSEYLYEYIEKLL